MKYIIVKVLEGGNQSIYTEMMYPNSLDEVFLMIRNDLLVDENETDLSDNDIMNIIEDDGIICYSIFEFGQKNPIYELYKTSKWSDFETFSMFGGGEKSVNEIKRFIDF